MVTPKQFFLFMLVSVFLSGCQPEIHIDMFAPEKSGPDASDSFEFAGHDSINTEISTESLHSDKEQGEKRSYLEKCKTLPNPFFHSFDGTPYLLQNKFIVHYDGRFLSIYSYDLENPIKTINIDADSHVRNLIMNRGVGDQVVFLWQGTRVSYPDQSHTHWFFNVLTSSNQLLFLKPIVVWNDAKSISHVAILQDDKRAILVWAEVSGTKFSIYTQSISLTDGSLSSKALLVHNMFYDRDDSLVDLQIHRDKEHFIVSWKQGASCHYVLLTQMPTAQTDFPELIYPSSFSCHHDLSARQRAGVLEYSYKWTGREFATAGHLINKSGYQTSFLTSMMPYYIDIYQYPEQGKVDVSPRGRPVNVIRDGEYLVSLLHVNVWDSEDMNHLVVVMQKFTPSGQPMWENDVHIAYGRLYTGSPYGGFGSTDLIKTTNGYRVSFSFWGDYGRSYTGVRTVVCE